MSSKPIILSGIKPTGKIHLANYFAAMKPQVELKSTYAMIADYHALNLVQDGKVLSELIVDVVVDYLALGLDPKESIIFKQSDVSAHTELTWIFDTLVTMPYLERSHAYKDAVANGREINVGTFNYPVLMAADILLYNTDIVPVGQDQKQHVEYARDIAQKFNNTFGETFKLPKEQILKDVATIPGIDGRKMSKSYNNTIELFASDDEIKSKVMSIVTDSESDIPTNVYNIHALFRSKDELDALYAEKKGKYRDLKEALVQDVIDLVSPFRKKREELLRDRSYILKVLKEGGDRARAVAEKKMDEVKKKIGVSF